MKLILTMFLALITLQGMTQKPHNSASLTYHGVPGDTLRLTYAKSDTLFIIRPLLIHFISVDGVLYQIVEHKPTIELVPKPVRIFDSWPGSNLINPVFTVPN